MVVLFLCNVPEVDSYTFLMSGFQRGAKDKDEDLTGKKRGKRTWRKIYREKRSEKIQSRRSGRKMGRKR